ncbi:cellobiose dehydrogenase-like protein [Microthyrium microscopicum]|uniref:Cellobiose dehydrogenase-like protein n=1 Tax=Microthyrium microscopicum TaxID=703497 RepID=A0A6A6U7K5_9PEZI|nr:cellobiose dehydrogenase-like protein [Microthyrium microscopicum]
MYQLLISFILSLAAVSTAAPVQNETRVDSAWDIIVIGAGPAGIIVAERMSKAGKKTLLLEGGGPSYWITGGRQKPAWLDNQQLSRVDVPGLYKSIFADQGNLTCAEHANAFTGCTLGGSSAINAGLFFEPPRSDFDTYFPKGWKHKDVSAAIDRVYDTVPSDDVYSQDDKFYVQSGYVAAKKWLVDGAGYANVDINKEADNKSKVFGRPIFDYVNGQRGGPVRTYLQDAIKRKNFQLQMNTRVERIIRNGDTATGVSAIVNGTAKVIKLASGGRVISSGGALQSPALLWFSGIGDPALRANLTAGGKLDGVSDWINNAEVGNGLFDNPNTFIELSNPSIQSYVHNYSNPIPADALAYTQHRSGPYSFASETSAFWDTLKVDNHTIGFQGTIDSSGFADWTSNNTITLNVYGTSGLFSSGKVELNDQYLPGPDNNVYYSDSRDGDAIATFIHSIFAKLDPKVLTPLNIPLNSTQTQIRDYITSSTAYTRGEVNHWSSSCRIGKCVDANTVVKGTKNIHVVDASIVAPLTVNPQFGVMIAAEHASDLILKLGKY